MQDIDDLQNQITELETDKQQVVKQNEVLTEVKIKELELEIMNKDSQLNQIQGINLYYLDLYYI